jgi:predicted component of type VI protein secretion system
MSTNAIGLAVLVAGCAVIAGWRRHHGRQLHPATRAARLTRLRRRNAYAAVTAVLAGTATAITLTACARGHR